MQLVMSVQSVREPTQKAELIGYKCRNNMEVVFLRVSMKFKQKYSTMRRSFSPVLFSTVDCLCKAQCKSYFQELLVKALQVLYKPYFAGVVW